MIKNAPPGSLGLCHQSGWITAENFQLYLKHFIKHVKYSNDEPMLLVLGNHDSHVSIGSVDIAKNNGVVLLKFLPRCTHKLQPLDRSVFGPFKKCYNNACTACMV